MIDQEAIKNMTKRVFIVTLALLLVAACTIPAVAWFARTAVFDKDSPNPKDLAGSSNAAYFESGNGTEDDPYIISSSVHLYNLAWLQYIGYFNKGSVHNGQEQSYFELKNNIDMDGLTIPPIGTTEYPFIGHFDGKNHVISSVNTANAKSALEQRPTDAQFQAANDMLSKYSDETATEVGNVMGFFGVIGSYAGEATQSTVNPSIIAVKNFGLTTYTLTSGETNVDVTVTKLETTTNFKGATINGTEAAVSSP